MDVTQKIVADHKVKSDQVRKLKGALKNTVSKQKLNELLKLEESSDVVSSHYLGSYGFDDKGYARACDQREARIGLLKEILSVN